MTTMLPAPTTPYHRLGRTPAHRWWLPIVATMAVLIGWSIVGCVFGVAASGLAIAGGAGVAIPPLLTEVLGVGFALAAIGTVTPVVLFAARWIQGRPAGTVSSVAGRLRWPWLRTCLIVAVPTSLLGLGGTWALVEASGLDVLAGQDAWVGWAPFLGSMVMVVLIVPFQAAGEEYLCRGWLLQAIGAFGRTPWPAVAGQAVIFAAAHGWQGPWAAGFFLLFGAVAGVLTVRTGGLEAAIALHVVNNVVGLGVYAAYGALDQAGLGTSANWQHVIVDAALVSVYTAVVLLLARRRQPAPALATASG